MLAAMSGDADPRARMRNCVDCRHREAPKVDRPHHYRLKFSDNAAILSAELSTLPAPDYIIRPRTDAYPRTRERS